MQGTLFHPTPRSLHPSYPKVTLHHFLLVLQGWFPRLPSPAWHLTGSLKVFQALHKCRFVGGRPKPKPQVALSEKSTKMATKPNTRLKPGNSGSEFCGATTHGSNRKQGHFRSPWAVGLGNSPRAAEEFLARSAARKLPLAEAAEVPDLPRALGHGDPRGRDQA